MPSQARILARDKMLPELDRILHGHSELRKGKKGPDPHQALLKSGLVMLCATWEVYCENVVFESAKRIRDEIGDPDKLPDSVKRKLNAEVHDENVYKSDPMKLAGAGWKQVYERMTENACNRFNTPKSDKLDKLFFDYVGLKNVSRSWTYGYTEVDDFVSRRGEVAHRGSDSAAITKDQLRHFKVVIAKTVSDTDDALYSFLKSTSVLGRSPWQKTSK